MTRACERRPAEQPRLGRAVGRHVAVIVEMIAREIGERRGVEAHAGAALLIERVRGDFHGHGVERRARAAAPAADARSPHRAWCAQRGAARRRRRRRACRCRRRAGRQSSSACASSQAQVVLPLVPVMPATVRLAEGAPKKRSAMKPSCARRFGTARTTNRCSRPRAAVTPRRRLPQHRARAARRGARRKLQPVMRARRGRRETPRPGVTWRLSSVRSETSSRSGTSDQPAEQRP